MLKNINIKRCIRCRMPSSQQFYGHDEFGVCKACQSSEQKMRIDWVLREKKLREILNFYKSKSGNNYDCIIPISGGKDSAYQLYIIKKIYKMKPLAVTFSHNWFTKIGRENLKKMTDRLGVDLIEFTPNRDLVNNLSRQSIEKIGDSCWHCHMGVDSFPLHIAVKFNIPLLIFGESVAESGKATYLDQPDYTIDYFLKHSSIVRPNEMLCGKINEKDLNLFNWPKSEDLNKVGVKRIHLADFIYWDAEKQTEFVRDFLDWKEADVEGTYKKYKSVECIMPGVHDYSKFLKRGFGRGTDFSALDLRNGIMNLNEAEKISILYDSNKPKILDYFLKIADIDEKTFNKFIKRLRSKKIKNIDKLVTDKTLPAEQEILEAKTNLDEEIKIKQKISNIDDKFIFPIFNNELIEQEKKVNSKFQISKNLEKKFKKFIHSSALQQKKFIIENSNLYKEIANYQLEYIKTVNKYVNAWSYFDENLILEKINIINNKLKQKNFSNIDKGLGIFIGVKDIFNTMDMPTGMGSDSWKNRYSGFDARVIHNLRLNSFILAGKTETAEFAVSHQNKTKYIYNENRYPGTSSSGSASVIASRMVPLSLASQTAGSTIRPASYNGIFGFKPSFGTIPRTGVLKTSDTLDTISFMSSSFEDIEFFYNILRVKGKNYPYANLVDEKFNKKNIKKKYRILNFKLKKINYNINPEVEDNYQKYIIKLKKKGFIVDECKVDLNFLKDVHVIHDNIYSKSLSYYFKQERLTDWDKIKDITKDKIIRGDNISLNEYENYISHQKIKMIKFDSFLKKYDFIITPSTLGFGLNSIDEEKDDYCLIWTFLGLPSINLPLFTSLDGYPFGLQVVGKRYDDLNLLHFCDLLIKLGLCPDKSIIPEKIKFF